MLLKKQIDQLSLHLHFCPHQRAPKAGKVLLYVRKETKSVRKTNVTARKENSDPVCIIFRCFISSFLLLALCSYQNHDAWVATRTDSMRTRNSVSSSKGIPELNTPGPAVTVNIELWSEIINGWLCCYLTPKSFLLFRYSFVPFHSSACHL